MDSEATRRKRLEDIEAKRKRLEEMRKSRAAPSTTSTTAVLVDTMIHSSPLRQSLQKGSSSSEGQLISNVNKTENHNTIDATNELVNALLQNSPHSIEDHMTNVEPKVVVPVKSREEMLNEKIQSFSIVKNVSNTVSILPLIPVTYEKGIQTGERDHDDIEEEEHYDDNDRLTNPPLSSKVDSHQMLDDKIRGTSTPSTVETTVKAVLSSPTTSVASMKLTDAQRSNVITSKDFIFFLSKSSLLVERALSISESHIDLLKDFSIDDRGQDDNQSNSNDKVLQLSSSSSYDSDITAGRPVMDLKWSHLIPDLFLVAYGSKASSSSSSSSSLSSFGMSYSSQASMVNSIHSNNSSNSRGGGGGGSSSLGNEDIPGLVCVWSKDLHTRPEFRFIASSPILSALFHTSEQHIIVGGCYSGQILVWDMRVQSGKSISIRELPVQKSSITGRGHKQPVYAMSMIISPSTSTSSTSSLTSSSGASSSSSMMIIYELLSISTDGLLCRWDITRLVEPLSCSFLFSDLGTSIRSSLMMSFSNTDYSSSGPLHIGSSSSSSSNNAAVIGPQFNISAMAVRSMDSMIINSSHEATNDVLFGSGSGLLIRSAVPFKEGCPAAWKVYMHHFC
jgi:dynein intermediate chain